MLPLSKREFIFRRAIDTVRQAHGEQLHLFLERETGEILRWRQTDRCPPAKGMIGEGKLDDGRTCRMVLTAPCEVDPSLVSVVFVHEIAHLILGHPEEGHFVFGFYTRREAEANAFALAYLYSLAEAQCPCGRSLTLHQIVTAMRKMHKDDRGFYYSNEERMADLRLIRSLRTEILGDRYECNC